MMKMMKIINSDGNHENPESNLNKDDDENEQNPSCKIMTTDENP